MTNAEWCIENRSPLVRIVCYPRILRRCRLQYSLLAVRTQGLKRSGLHLLFFTSPKHRGLTTVMLVLP